MRCIILTLICPLALVQMTLAASVFDDFRDGNAGDGSPVTWVPGLVDGGNRSVVDGSYRISAVGFASSFGQELPFYTDATIETQLRIVDGSGFAGVFGRSPSFSTYFAAINADGFLGIGESMEDGSVSALGTFQTGLDPTIEDVVLRFDLLGSTLSATVWSVGEAIPEPQVVVQDDTLSLGGVGFVIDGGNEGSTIDYRYFRLVPEPTSNSLAAMALVFVFAFRRSTRGH